MRQTVQDVFPVWEVNRISVVVPVLNEEGIVIPFLRRLTRFQGIEIVVVDGGSQDRTLPLLQDFSRRHSVGVSVAPGGRARQMNEGAARSTGDILFFLHVDSSPPQTGMESILEAMKAKDVVGGAFRLQIDSRSLFLRMVSRAANARSRYFGLPFGDQGVFVRRDVFEKLGGYADLPLMEDVDFIRRLKKSGQVILLKEAVTTSARKWNQEGYLYNSLRNVILLVLYFLGVSPRRLGWWYHG